MKNRLLVLVVLLLCSLAGAYAQTIVKAEYFVDTDPGIGAATNVTITAGVSIQNATFTTSLASLSAGTHSLYFRVKDSNGFWSSTEQTPLYNLLPTTVPSAVNITNAEYYIDSDPGVGAATSITITPGLSLSDLSFPISLSTLSSGTHNLFVRVKDASGKWSSTESTPFYKLTVTPNPAAVNLTNAEYFVDTDPGFGSGTAITITPGLSITDLIVPVNVNSLTDGNHTLFIRFKDANGRWSLSQSTNISVCGSQAVPVASTATNITTTGFTANWAGAVGATSYALDVSADNFATFVSGFNNLTVSALTKTVTGLASGTAYKYRVRGVGTCTSVSSGSITVTTLPAAPIAIAATSLSSSGFTANWNATVGATGYLLDISTDNFNTFVAGYDSKGEVGTSDVVSGLTPGTTYQYRVRATKASSTSASSNVISATTNKANQTITFNPIASAIYGDAPITLSASASSGLSVLYASDNTIVAAVNGNVVTIVGAGSAIITASQAGNNSYSPANNVQQTLTVNKATQTITFTAVADKTLGDAPFDLGATASSSLAMSYATTSDKITISGSTVTLAKAGRVTITASQAGNTSFNAATSVDQSFCIKPPKPTIALSGANTESITLTSSNSSGNQWFLNGTAIPNAANATLSVTQPGVYKVQTTADDCSSAFSDNSTLIVTGEIYDPFESVKLYPNPAHNYVQVTGIKEINESMMSDAMGRTFPIELRKDGDNYRGDVHSLPSGLYVLKIRQGNSWHQIKLLKN